MCGEQDLGGINLFVLISLFSLVFCIPLALVMESHLWPAAVESAKASVGAGQFARYMLVRFCVFAFGTACKVNQEEDPAVHACCRLAACCIICTIRLRIWSSTCRASRPSRCQWCAVTSHDWHCPRTCRGIRGFLCTDSSIRVRLPFRATR